MSILETITKEVEYRLIRESMARIKKCFDQLSDEEIWKRPNGNLVSMGNLVLHLSGNVRQYILFGLGGNPDKRLRQTEFDHQEIISKETLLEDMDQLMVEVQNVLRDLNPECLTQKYSIQGIDITGFGILMHVVEHFSYHVGQITWYTKLVKDMDMQYYAGKDLNITG